MSKLKVGDRVFNIESKGCYTITKGAWVGEVTDISGALFAAKTVVLSDTPHGIDAIGHIWTDLMCEDFEAIPNPITSVAGCTVALEHATIEQLEAALKAKALVRIAELRKYT